MTNGPSNRNLNAQIVDLLESAKNNLVRTINPKMVLPYFEIGRIRNRRRARRERAY
ncbi:MAG: hypothetical protein ACI9DJ_002634 [Algoriphagus sp.]|jgi:hypothetical protein